MNVVFCAVAVDLLTQNYTLNVSFAGGIRVGCTLNGYSFMLR